MGTVVFPYVFNGYCNGYCTGTVCELWNSRRFLMGTVTGTVRVLYVNCWHLHTHTPWTLLTLFPKPESSNKAKRVYSIFTYIYIYIYIYTYEIHIWVQVDVTTRPLRSWFMGLRILAHPVSRKQKRNQAMSNQTVAEVTRPPKCHQFFWTTPCET